MAHATRTAQHHAAVLGRLERALRDLYHNATPRYPTAQNEYEAHLFQSWFAEIASDEISSIASGGAYGPIRCADFAQPGRSWQTQQYAYNKALRDRERSRSRSNRLDSRATLTNAMWECISDYGTLYQWGRGGRTLAPDDLVRQRGGSAFCIKSRESVAQDLPYAEIVTMVRILESFNAYVAAWCKSVPEQWQDAKEANEYQADIDAHDGKRAHRVCRTEWR